MTPINRKPPQSKKSKNIVARVTPAMFDEIKAQALSEGLTVMDYIRKLHTEHIQHVKEQVKT